MSACTSCNTYACARIFLVCARVFLQLQILKHITFTRLFTCGKYPHVNMSAYKYMDINMDINSQYSQTCETMPPFYPNEGCHISDYLLLFGYWPVAYFRGWRLAFIYWETIIQRFYCIYFL